MNEIKLNNAFYRTLDYYIIEKGLTRSRLSILCDRDSTTLNKSKFNGKRWITMGFFLKICEVLGVEPQDFFNKMLKED